MCWPVATRRQNSGELRSGARVRTRSPSTVLPAPPALGSATTELVHLIARIGIVPDGPAALDGRTSSPAGGPGGGTVSAGAEAPEAAAALPPSSTSAPRARPTMV